MISHPRAAAAVPPLFDFSSPGTAPGSSQFWRQVMTDWYARCAYDPEVKQRFHIAARARLRRLATTLGFPSGSFDLRQNPGGIAVSGEITLHHEDVYIQVCQPATGTDSGILIRSCQADGTHRGTGSYERERPAGTGLSRMGSRERPLRFARHRSPGCPS